MINWKNSIPKFLVFSFLCISSYALASDWSPLIGLGLGSAMTSDLGESQNFPIQTPVTNQFYNYTANQSSQHVTLYHGFLGAEWPLQTNWALQAGLHYFQTAPLSADGNFLQGADLQPANSYAYSYDVVTRQLLAEGKLLYTIKKRFHPYFMLGLGTSFNKAYNYNTTATFTRMYTDNTTNSFSYALGLGFDTNINPHLRFGASYRFTDLGQVELGSATINNTAVSGTLSQSHLYANEILGQLTWII